MHVQSIRLKYFKRFRDKSLDFSDPETGAPRPLVVLVGENGSGKSTVLQAIAATLGTATRRLHRPADLEWPGFDLALAGNSWNLPYEVILDVRFTDAELQATLDCFARVPGLQDRPDVTPPSSVPLTRLFLRESAVHAISSEQYFQFRGREYAKQVVKLVEEGHRVFQKVGTVFWYTEHRTSTSLTAEAVPAAERDEGNGNAEAKSDAYLRFDENLLRRRLADLMQFHARVDRGEYRLRPGQRDLFADLERAYLNVFPNRRFEGSVPRTDVDEVLSEPWFFLYDGHHQYEVCEMSGGERAIFPIVFDFANWHIHNSVVLIDEIELHLHPPLQQALIRALPRLGTGNQFIIATHSDWVADNVPADCVLRMEGAQ